LLTAGAVPGVNARLHIVEAATRANRTYMMMETVVYSREFLFVRELRDTGRLGRIQFLRGSHLHNVDGWPGYWEGLPPMHYATHCASPCLALVNGEAEYVSCLGSGRISEHLVPKCGSPFAFETAHGKVRGQDLGFEVTRFLFNVARRCIDELRRLRREDVVRVAARRGRPAGL
jgi:predicted dehydrogenase